MTLTYKHKGIVTTVIDVNYKLKTVKIKNFDSDPVNLAFGINLTPTFEDFEAFLESRCFPRQRDFMKLHLKELGLDYYDPLSIIRKTKGHLAGDYFELEIED